MIEIHDHISSSFNNELSVLDDSLIEMGSNLEKMFEETLLAINEKDETLAKKVISNDKNIDELEISVISQIQTLIANVLARCTPQMESGGKGKVAAIRFLPRTH